MEFHSHIGQDRWVAEVFKGKKNGYFLDFGALDGVLTSNTYYLEKELGWSGIVVEANPTSYPAVCRNRSAITINAALWGKSRELIEMVDAHGLTSAVIHKDLDGSKDTRAEITTRIFSVDTITPTELLRRHSTPRLIDYMSLDVEGAEIDVLNAFDFHQFNPALLTVEHSELPDRQQAIRDIILPYGYKVVKCRYDDWFWRPDLVAALAGADGFRDPEEVFNEVETTYVIH
ncbi:MULTISPECIES: FkbM family methyltransferase [Rhizobium/Agrobacterium group]|uniref:FkbM family methyltransferase n=1 Tax=Rhizobium/Agrobacterium group TaxID=227290 RepID=UPI000B404DAA|nr:MULTISPECIES: FkbM family methyltransferase [Rhizobium/Agrobacterium group]MCF1481640.1 FkbM family methyltransferase [Allorhizobium ampelinum]NSZ42589.1 FkbM family methyltransferase [Agrobacterium vitis]NTA26297.1 FkbM family methyltransferase [Allorhizobium ampelinum]OVE95599.1 hypothetical protein B7W85_07260 [Allorhizobium ampelinum]